MEEAAVLNAAGKKKIKKNCINCFNCRVRVAVNLADPLNTLVTPQNRREGITSIRCRIGYWDETSGIPRLLFNIGAVEKLEVVCPHFEGEDDEEDNSALLL